MVVGHQGERHSYRLTSAQELIERLLSSTRRDSNSPWFDTRCFAALLTMKRRRVLRPHPETPTLPSPTSGGGLGWGRLEGWATAQLNPPRKDDGHHRYVKAATVQSGKSMKLQEVTLGKVRLPL